MGEYITNVQCNAYYIQTPTLGLIQAAKTEEKYQHANYRLYRNHQNNIITFVWSPLCIPNNM